MKSEPWQIAAARFCVERKEFTLKELQNFLKNSPYEVNEHHIRNFFIENIQNPPGRQYNREYRKESEGVIFYTAPSELVAMITDFDELKEARKNARSAFLISMAALAVSAIGAFFQYLSI